MADAKISALSAATEMRPGDELVVARAGASLKVTGAMVSGRKRVARASNTILGVADYADEFYTSATFTQTLTAAATLGAGWWVIIRNDTNDGTTVLTVDPNGAETIDGLSTMTMYSGEVRVLVCDGTNFASLLLEGGFARFTANGSFIVPAGIEKVSIECIGGGGGGGGGRGGAAASI